MADTFTIQLIVRVYDTVTSTYCFDTSALDTVYVYPLPDAPTITGPLAINCDMYHLRLIASSGVSGTFNWSNGTYGPVNDVFVGGPTRVWFTDLHGCKSHTDKYVPLDPNVYKPYFPNGCYDVCNQMLPLSLAGPRCVPFTSWKWINSSTTMSAGLDDTLGYEDLTSNDSYLWELNTGLCTKKIGTMNLSGIKCNACQGVNLSATLHCTPDNPSCYDIYVGYSTTYPATSYVLGTNIGPISPFTGSWPSPGYYTDTLTFTTLATSPLPDSVTVKLILTTADGNKCYDEVTIPLDTCSWIAERGAITHNTSSPLGGGRDGASALQAFPNPASGHVTIRYQYGHTDAPNGTLAVYDAMGRKMEQMIPTTNDGTWQMDVARWTPGLYIVRMEANGATLHTARLVIVH